MPSPFDQSAYQVRMEWGVDGVARLARSDVVVVVDVLLCSSTVTAAAERGETVALDAAAGASSIDGAAVAKAAAAAPALVLLGGIVNASAVARAVLAEQVRRGARTSVAVIAAGEGAPASPRFAVEDLLGAGAVVAALGDLGIDHCSPEAAAAGESFRALRGAVRHLMSASGSGRELAERGLAAEVASAASLDASAAVPVLRDGFFRAL
ncbi:2-phosphosulfolactate phosphatase [Microbacterium ulmi]|uniref:Probable 2-phosphosulfolactate phosphatase n=1 Tax=Microbacterium ulmi TaxID=179095 RepID=A0A7Y2M2A3_9MICO|nr:2-phosphosulfolactate phosphatase [Microbacterium ulmi]NII70074.1 2-phosphosulfolactate phosphatase [Microbacterium ulmi]NNH05180.1 phosphosulfolactate phosphohydrolase [Microbacterium ulmi]